MIGEEEHKITQQADDTTLFLKDIQSLHHALNLLYSFRVSSNLKLNYTKTEILTIGSMKIQKNLFNLNWVKERVYALGTWFYKDQAKGHTQYYELKLKSLKNTLQHYQRLHLTWYGKVNVIKTFALSKLTFCISSLPTPQWFVQEVQKEVNSFLWNNKPPRIKFTSVIADYNWGGLRLPHIDSIVIASKAMWVKRLKQPSCKIRKYLAQFLPNMALDDFLECDINPNDLPMTIPFFYRQVLHAWFTLKSKCHPTNSVLWLNRNITVDRQPIFYKEWYSNGILYVKDLLDENQTVMNYDMFCQKYGKVTHFLQFESVRRAVISWLKTNSKYTSNTVDQIDILTNKILYRRQIDKICQKPTGVLYWSERLQSEFSDNEWMRIFSMPSSITFNNYVKELQLKINHNTYACDSFVQI